jgi:hypothetical protein
MLELGPPAGHPAIFQSKLVLVTGHDHSRTVMRPAYLVTTPPTEASRKIPVEF